MVIKGKFKYLKWEDKQKVSFFFSQRLRHPYGGEKGEEERKKRKKRKERKEKNKGMFFFMESSVFWMFRVIGMIARVFLWRLVCSKPRVLVERSHKPLIC